MLIGGYTTCYAKDILIGRVYDYTHLHAHNKWVGSITWNLDLYICTYTHTHARYCHSMVNQAEREFTFKSICGQQKTCLVFSENLFDV